jgi:polyribonucleotide nucleotidyltransferase
MVLSADPQRDPSTLAIIGAGASLAISDIPFQHVLGGVRVGSVNGKLVANPSYDETRESKVNIVVAGTEEGIVMVEAGAQHASEEEVLEAIEYGHTCCKKIAAGIRELVAKVGKKKWEVTPPAVNKALYASIEVADPQGTDRRARHQEVSQARKLSSRSRSQEERWWKRFPKNSKPKPRNCSTR